MNRELDPINGRAIAVGLEIGLFDFILKGSHSIEDIARATNCAVRGLRPLLYLLSSIDLIRQNDEGYYSLPARTPRYLALEWPHKWAALPEVPQYSELARAVRTGKPLGAPIESEESAGSFFAPIVPSLFDRHIEQAKDLVRYIPLGVDKVLDLGCGTAVWSLPLAAQRPNLRVIAVDRPLMINKVAAGFVSSQGLMNKYRLIGDDYHKVSFNRSEFELVILGQILHADGWSRSLELLKKVHQWLAPKGMIVIAEIIGQEPRSQSYEANVFDLMMLMLTERGVVFSARELEKMLGESGFAGAEWIEGPGEYPVLIGRKN